MRQRLRIEIPILLALALTFSCASNPKNTVNRAADPAALIDRGRVFTGTDGARVELIELKEPGKALVRITGIRSEQADKVFEHRINENGRRLEYITQIDGRDQYTLVRETSRHSSDASWRLYVRGAEFRGMDILYDEEESEKLDTVALYRVYEEQRDTGVLEAIQRFDRPEEEAYVEEKLAEERAGVAEACQSDVEFAVDWSTIDDETLKSLSIHGYCEHVLDALGYHCKHEPGRRFAEGIESVTCRFDDEMSLDVDGPKMTWTVNREGVNMYDFARKAVGKTEFEGSTVAGQIALASTHICADEGREHYVAFAPEGSEVPGMLYGDGEKMFRVNTPELLSGGWFFEPRHFNPQYNSSFRGADLRFFSKVDLDDEESTCSVVCGTKETELELLPADEVRELMGNVEITPTPMPRMPHALARDRRGIYYFVDRSTEPGRERDFRLYVGPIGNVKRQAMKNVVSDSEGEIFSSRAGELRFILGAQEALWITGRRERKLLKVPIEDNWNLIYNRLGVYFGARLGNPCDDFGVE